MTLLAQALPLNTTVDDLRAGRLDLGAFVEGALDRVEETALELRALVREPGRRERVLGEAQALLDRYPVVDGRPPLFGAVLGVKDIFAVDGLPTGGGSAVPAATFAMPEATAVARLRRAGAIVLGKTITTEFAFFAPGATTNPYDQTHTPGGSSSGSAAAVGAGLASLALGTQTVGSVLRPAAYCGVVGFKPSFGRIPRDGIIPFSQSVDTVGTFASNVAATALAATALCDDWQPREASDRPVLGVPEGPFLAQAAPEGLAAFESQLARLADAGYEVRRVPALLDIAAINARHQALISGQFYQVHRRWFDDWGALYRGASAQIFDEGRHLGEIARAAAEPSPGWLRADMDRAMTRAGVDLWLSPAATGPAPAGLRSTGITLMNLPWTHAGMPAITIPAGQVAGLPVGLQAAARYAEDERLLGWAAGLEAALR